MKLTDPVLSIMTPDVITLGPDQTLLDVKHIFEKRLFHHHIPIVSDKKLIGIISLIDFMRHVGNASLDDTEPIYQMKVQEIMTFNPLKINANNQIIEAVRLLGKGNVHALVVTNDSHEVVGMVSTKDLLNKLILQN
jgi:predicted transcriptional regulator